MSQDGVDVEIINHVAPVHTDTHGGTNGPPFDEQTFNQSFRVSCLLMFYDESVLAKIRGPWVTATAGTYVAMGSLFGAGSHYHRLLILSPTASLPFNFLTARVEGGMKKKLGTTASGWQITWFGYAYGGAAGTTSGNVMFNTTTS